MQMIFPAAQETSLRMPRRLNSWMASRAQRNCPVKFTSSTNCQSARVIRLLFGGMDPRGFGTERGEVRLFEICGVGRSGERVEQKSAKHAWIRVEDHGDYLFKFALLRLRDPAKAEDMVQETFL